MAVEKNRFVFPQPEGQAELFPVNRTQKKFFKKFCYLILKVCVEWHFAGALAGFGVDIYIVLRYNYKQIPNN